MSKRARRAGRESRIAKKSSDVPTETNRGALTAVIVAALVGITLYVYLPVRNFDFVNWDDQLYLTENPNVQAGLNWRNLVWALTTTHSPYWHPLTWLTHMLDVTMFGMDAGWHHVTSMLIHIASTLVLFAALRRMTRETGKSAFVAAIFAVHPLHVESVAWLAERKDVLSTFFLMTTIWMYVRYVERPGAGRYVAIVVMYALALMSKPMVMTLPVVLLLLDWWPLGRWGAGAGAETGAGSADPAYKHVIPAYKRLIMEKLPLFAMAGATAIATVIVQRRVGAVAGLDLLPLGARVRNALVGYVLYVWKTFWPTHLAAFYPFRSYPNWIIALAALALVSASGFAIACRRRWPYVTVGWLWYVVTVAPVIGLTQAGEQAMADRFMYVPIIGLLFIATWGGVSLLARFGLRRQSAVVMAIVLVAASAVTARAQTRFWADSHTLWAHALEVTDANAIAYENMGQALRERGQLAQAITSYQQALKLAPPHSPVYEATIHNSLGLVLTREGKPDQAAEHFAEAVRLNPGFAEAQSNYGNALAAQGNFNEAIGHYRAALAIKPALTEALVGEGGSLVRLGRADEALTPYREALRIDPNLAQAHNGLGSVFSLQHRDDQAMAEFNRALELKPDLPSAHLNIAIVLLRKGDTAGARRHLETALTIDPGYEPARNVLARIQ